MIWRSAPEPSLRQDYAFLVPAHLLSLRDLAGSFAPKGRAQAFFDFVFYHISLPAHAARSAGEGEARELAFGFLGQFEVLLRGVEAFGAEPGLNRSNVDAGAETLPA